MYDFVTGFQFCEQQVEDVLRAIETIEPVIGIFRRYSEIWLGLDEMNTFTIESKGKINAYQEVLELNIEEELSEDIASKIIEVNNICTKFLEEQQELTEYAGNLLEELDEYLKYIGSFDWLYVDLAKEVLYRIPQEDRVKLISFLLLFLNEQVDIRERKQIFEYLCDSIEDSELLYAISDDSLIEYIITTDTLNK